MRASNLDLAAYPVPALIRRIAVPAGLGMFFNTMYNVVDTWFGGRISTTALAAMSLSFPVFFILLSFSVGFSTGVTAVVGNALGQKDERRARELVLHALLFGFFLAACVSAVGLLAAPSLFRLLGAREEYLAAALSYVRIIFAGSVFFIFSAFFNAVLTATGNTRPYRNFLAAGFFANIALDPWFIYGGWGIPAMGLRGVAVATVVIQAAGCAYLFREVRRTGLISRIPERFRLRGEPIGEILAQGLPASVNYLTIAAGIFVITYFVGSFGREAVAAYGAAVRIEQIVLLPAIGLNTAVLALTAQNAGARRFDRIRETRKWALIYGGFMMAAGLLLVFFLGGSLLRIFTQDEAVIAAGTAYLRVDAFTLYAYVILFTHVGILQGLKKPVFPVIIGLYRQIAAPVGVFLLFTRVLGLGLAGIWWGILIVTWSAALISFFYADRILREAGKLHEAP